MVEQLGKVRGVRKTIEYAVYADDELQSNYATKAKAEAAAEACVAAGMDGVEVERWTNTWNKFDGNLIDRDFETVKTY